MLLPNLGRSEEHTSELQSHSDLYSFPTRRSSDLWTSVMPVFPILIWLTCTPLTSVISPFLPDLCFPILVISRARSFSFSFIFLSSSALNSVASFDASSKFGEIGRAHV